MTEHTHVQVEARPDEVVTVTKHRYVPIDEMDPKSRKRLETYEVEEPFGYMVYFSKGHSIRVRTDDELKRLGLDGQRFRNPNNYIDRESPKVMVERKTRHTRRQGTGATA